MRVVEPNRVERRFVQEICRPPSDVFPLLCPVREVEWVNGWNPSLVLTESGVAEKGCVFVTPGTPHDAVWVVSEHDPVSYHLEIIKVIPEMVAGTITIDLEAGANDTTRAHIKYAYTALSERGKLALEDFTVGHFNSFMEMWERELNYFLVRGSKLELNDS